MGNFLLPHYLLDVTLVKSQQNFCDDLALVVAYEVYEVKLQHPMKIKCVMDDVIPKLHQSPGLHHKLPSWNLSFPPCETENFPFVVSILA